MLRASGARSLAGTVMRERTLHKLDWLFRNYIVFCISIALGGVALGTIVSFLVIPDLKIEWMVWIWSGNLIGTGLCLVVAKLLKARFHPRVMARLAGAQQNEKA